CRRSRSFRFGSGSRRKVCGPLVLNEPAERNAFDQLAETARVVQRLGDVARQLFETVRRSDFGGVVYYVFDSTGERRRRLGRILTRRDDAPALVDDGSRPRR